VIHPLRHLTIGLIYISAFSIVFSIHASAAEMSLKQVITSVLEHHPDLNVSRIDTAIAATETNRIKGVLDPIITANITASAEKIPTISNFQASKNRIGQLNSSISKALSNGDTIGANITYTRTSQAFNSPFASQLALFNPSYRNQININYRHPLFKGADRPNYNQALISAEAGLEQTKQQYHVLAHRLTLRVINAYYQLASDDINIDIAKQAVQRAKKLLAYQRSRERFGLIERADRLQAEALLAARNTGLQRSLSQRLNNQNTLNRLMLHPASANISVQRSRFLKQQDATLNDESIQRGVALAKRLRPELQVFDAQMQAADAQLLIALDADQLQLDVVATLGTRALKKSPLPAAIAGISARDHFASISLELSDALGRSAVNAGIRKAELQRQRIATDRRRTLEQIQDDISAAQTAITAGMPALAVAQQQEKAEQRKFNAEMKRYRQGRSDTATLVQFEGELRNADLNAQLQQLTIELAQTQLAWAQGRLLYDFNIIQRPENMAGSY